MTQAPIARGCHSVRFFESETDAHRTIVEFFSEDARLDDTCIMVARTATFAAVRQLLIAHPATIVLADRIRFFATDGLSQIVTGNELDRERAEEFFLQMLSHVPASDENARVRFYGEGVDVLCEQDRHAIALQIEDLAGLLFALEPRLSMLCGYRIGHFAGEHGSMLRAVCGKHTDVGPLPPVPPPNSPGGQKTAIPGVDATGASTSRMVYVLDDDASMRRSLGRLLTVSNFRVRMFDSAEAFLKEAATLSEGCLLLDIQLGGMTGLELIALLADEGIPLPIIAMSGFLDEKTESEALRLGARAFLHKPFEPKVLLEAIERAMP